MKSRLFFSILVPVCVLLAASLFYPYTAYIVKDSAPSPPGEVICEPLPDFPVRTTGKCHNMFAILFEIKETNTLFTWIEKITGWQ